jgi:hypothetical protein
MIQASNNNKCINQLRACCEARVDLLMFYYEYHHQSPPASLLKQQQQQEECIDVYEYCRELMNTFFQHVRSIKKTSFLNSVYSTNKRSVWKDVRFLIHDQSNDPQQQQQQQQRHFIHQFLNNSILEISDLERLAEELITSEEHNFIKQFLSETIYSINAIIDPRTHINI